MGQFDYRKVKAEVHDYCSMADFNTFDEAGIVYALRDMAYDTGTCISSIDDVDPESGGLFFIRMTAKQWK